MNETILILLPVLLFSIIIHEYAHGYVAEWWGDPTARMLGRLTLNPLPHIDMFGSILVPLVLWVTGSPFLFGWAKPVPVTIENLRDRKWGDIMVSLAGPASNIVLALVFTALLLGARIATGGQVSSALELFTVYGILINLVLAIFNLLPIPPLDGSHVVAALLPRPAAYRYRSLARYGLLIVFALLFFGLGPVVFGPARIMTGLLVELAVGLS